MRELDKISSALFDKIRSRFSAISIGNENAKSVSDPESARFFNFDYVTNTGKNLGNITISLVDEASLKIYYGANITNNLSEIDETDWFRFLRELRKFARRNMLSFDIRDINRSNLDLKDLKQQSKADNTYNTDELAIAESKLYGVGNNRRVSFADVGPHKLVIKHKNQINPDQHGARARHIEHIFIETPIGERFLLDHVNLHGARAIANHMQYGGQIHDAGSALINAMVNEMSSMKHFVRSMRHRTFEDSETSGMVEAAVYRYNEIKNYLKKFQGRRGHDLLMAEVEKNNHDQNNQFDVDQLRERFVKKIYDDRFDDALPYVYKAYLEQKKNKPIGTTEFESWANDITGSVLSENNDVDAILNLIDEPILAGMDGIDAVAVLSDIALLDNETLKSAIRKAANIHGPDIDVRRLLAGWLAKNGKSEVANQIIQVMQQQNSNTEKLPTSPQNKSNTYGDNTMDSSMVYENLENIKRLSGI